MSRYTPAGPSSLQRRERATLAPTTSYTAATPSPYSGTPNGAYATPIPSGSNSPFRPSSRQDSLLPQWSREQGIGGRGMADDLEGRNDERLEGLVGKVRMLKDADVAQLSYGIGKEVRDSAVQLTEMNDAFAETGGILSGTFRRMNKMAKRQGGNWCYFIMFLVLVLWIFIITWWWRR
ncbi:hypothetical protein CALVIDRAFT_552492 [Calocera viscosa TUFC12733]|uniref:t-SNARE coiled-coil homology domain-containing protein n=1 Tax=Calocera viscosa (strain TUFC12733) TaxID=1330018 RepID=A0A167RD37_CALVF|nr:hypothetical protein CALVIDRAFT_552492 [Calocera viscosa TUFC12733]